MGRQLRANGFFLIARCDGQPIVWPTPTHAPAASAEVLAGEKLPWRSAAEIIDWSLPCPSVFDTREEIKAKYGLKAQHGQGVRTPLHTTTAKDRECMTLASLSKFYGGIIGASLKDPTPTITSVDHNALQTAHLVKLKGTNLGGPVVDPLQTMTAGEMHHGLVTTKIVKVESGTDLQNWQKIREVLNLFCRYCMKEDEIILFRFGSAW